MLELDITTNRVDCMNVYGVAREVAALYGLALRPPDTTAAAEGAPAGEALDVTIEAPDLCGRFCARVLDVTVGPSPAWLRDRLELVGVRSINNVVDLTNYVMLEMGQPSHAFDLARVPGGALVVRWSREGERVTTLDGNERTLPARVGVIAGKGGEPALALAGIMGGASSEIQDDTRVVALEAACWEPLAIRRAARALGMHTEASHRFERGADVAAGPGALDRLAHLAVQIGAGKLRPGLVERKGDERPGRTVRLRPHRVSALLGVEVPWLHQERTLEALGFLVTGSSVEATALVPTWRLDVAGEADLAEEIGRHVGLDKIAPALPPAGRVGGLRRSQRRERQIREILTGVGFTEVVNYDFVAGAELVAPRRAPREPAHRRAGHAAHLAGDARARHDAAHATCAWGAATWPCSSSGVCSFPGPSGPWSSAGWASCSRVSGTRATGRHPRAPFDLFDLKGVLELLFERLGEPVPRWDLQAEPPAFLHPGRAARLAEGGRSLGYAGVVHPDVRERLELKDEAVVLELDLERLLESSPERSRFRVLDRYPAVERDLSILCDEATPAAEIDTRVREAAGERLRSVSLVDRYTGNQVPPGKVSLTVSLRFQDRERTLTSEEVQAAMDDVIRELRAAGLEIRGE